MVDKNPHTFGGACDGIPGGWPTSRKFPRTLRDAFGPHTSEHIDDARTGDELVVLTCLVAALAFVTIVLIWG